MRHAIVVILPFLAILYNVLIFFLSIDKTYENNGTTYVVVMPQVSQKKTQAWCVHCSCTVDIHTRLASTGSEILPDVTHKHLTGIMTSGTILDPDDFRQRQSKHFVFSQSSRGCFCLKTRKYFAKGFEIQCPLGVRFLRPLEQRGAKPSSSNTVSTL